MGGGEGGGEVEEGTLDLGGDPGGGAEVATLKGTPVGGADLGGEGGGPVHERGRPERPLEQMPPQTPGRAYLTAKYESLAGVADSSQ